MERVARGFDTEPIQRGLARIPPRILELVGPIDFLCGVDATFVGLYAENTPIGFSGEVLVDREVAGCVFPEFQLLRPRSERVLTITLPARFGESYGYLDEPHYQVAASGTVPTVVHEFGHCLDHATGQGAWAESAYVGIPTFTEYALRRWTEAFAEAFTIWLYPELQPDQHGYLRDDPIFSFFEELAR